MSTDLIESRVLTDDPGPDASAPVMDPAASRPRTGRNWRARWLVVLLIGCALFGLELAVLIKTQNPLYLPSLLLLGAAVLPVTLTTLLSDLQSSPGLSVARISAAAVLGGVVGTVLAGQLEFDAIKTMGSLPYLMVGMIEESAKLAVPVLLFSWRLPRPRAAQGLVLGVAAGSGFAAMETMGYGFVTLLSSHGDLHLVDHLLLLRALTSLGGHAAWTGLACAAWFAMYGARRPWLARLRFVAVFASVVCLHAQWDASVADKGYLLVSVAGFLMLASTVLGLRLRRPLRLPRAGDGPGSSPGPVVHVS